MGDGKTMNRRYRTVLERDPSGGYHASCPGMPGCHSQGETINEALANMREAMELYIESLLARGEPIPPEDGDQAA